MRAYGDGQGSAGGYKTFLRFARGLLGVVGGRRA